MDDIEKVQHLIEKGREIFKTSKSTTEFVNDASYYAWRAQCISFIYSCSLSLEKSRYVYSQSFQKQCYFYKISHVKIGIGILESVKEDLETAPIIEERSHPIVSISNLCERFHHVARQLRSRHNSRNTLDIQDEYDVQDLFHALLHLHFEDIRAEEWTPSFAGASSRMDFLLKQEQIIIEIKKTRQGLGAKEVGSQLIEDIGRYQNHPDCKVLICFVYDPEEKIANPRGIESDLSRVEENLTVHVLIRP
jgi:hypothetical protein